MHICEFQFIKPGIDQSMAYKGVYDPFLVVLSVVIASMAGYVALKIVDRIKQAPTLKSKRAWGITGAIAMGWHRYRGPGFAGYEVWRQRGVVEEVRLQVLADVADTSWVDTTAVPFTDYFYWIRMPLFGEEVDSQRRGISFELPPVQLTRSVFSSVTGTADLAWTSYGGRRRCGRSCR